MRRLLGYMIVACGLAAPANAAIASVQVKSAFATSSATSIPVTVTAIGAAHLVVVFTSNRDGASVTSVSDTGGNTYTHLSGSQVSFSTNNLLDCWYIENSTAGGTIVTASWGSNAPRDRGIVVYEWSGAATSTSFDSKGVQNDGLSPNPVGPSVVTGNANDAIMGAVISENTISGGATSGYTSDVLDSSGALLVSVGASSKVVAATSTYLGPGWTESNTHYAGITVAFKAAGGGVTASPQWLPLLGVGD